MNVYQRRRHEALAALCVALDPTSEFAEELPRTLGIKVWIRTSNLRYRRLLNEH